MHEQKYIFLQLKNFSNYFFPPSFKADENASKCENFYALKQVFHLLLLARIESVESQKFMKLLLRENRTISERVCRATERREILIYWAILKISLLCEMKKKRESCKKRMKRHEIYVRVFVTLSAILMFIRALAWVDICERIFAIWSAISNRYVRTQFNIKHSLSRRGPHERTVEKFFSVFFYSMLKLTSQILSRLNSDFSLCALFGIKFQLKILKIAASRQMRERKILLGKFLSSLMNLLRDFYC